MDGEQWHGLLVRPDFERIAALHLAKKDIESYLPLLPGREQSDSKTPATELPLFPGYVFCKCDVRRAVWTIPGVLAWVGRANGIHAISERQITDLRRILAARFDIQPWPFTPQGRRVRIEVGPLAGISGILQESADTRCFIFSIQLIRRSIALSLNTTASSHFAREHQEILTSRRMPDSRGACIIRSHVN